MDLHQKVSKGNPGAPFGAPMLGRCRLFLLLLASETNGWVLYGHHLAPENSRPKIYRWDAPADSTSDDGLGGAASPNQNTWPIFDLFRLCKAGGISYAVQSSFCQHILPRFYAETMFDLVDCEAILDSIVRGPTPPAAPLATR